jgi:serine-type D-Ala-D-Ala carboxypeptidase/endopeptidase (penicillin-binding protein 4)
MPHARAIILLLGLLCALPGGTTAAQPTGQPGLARDLDRLLRTAGPGVRYGVLVVSLDRGDTLFAHQPDTPLTPASNMKLYSTAAALYYLGPAYRFHTYLMADGAVRGGVIHGDLVLYGTGDPAIGRGAAGSAALRALADSLRLQGVHEITGDVVGDGSYFDERWIADGWAPYDRLAWYAPPVGSLSFAENRVVVHVGPGDRAGSAARVRTDPATHGLAVLNRVRTVATGETRVVVRHGERALVIEGQIAARHRGVRHEIPVVDPANYAAAALHQALRERGIQVGGGVRGAAAGMPAGRAAGPADGRRVLAIHASAPLGELASVTNHVSHNLFAEQLTKAAGRAALGEGSFEAGARLILRFLARDVGADTTSLRVLDGSGLSAGSRLSARSTVRLLEFMAGADVADAFLASLPTAGDPRGLRRMFGTPAADNLRAKTGTLRTVSSLSGYVRSADGERLAFSVIANDVADRPRAKATEDAIGRRLAAFRRGPTASAASRGQDAPGADE